MQGLWWNHIKLLVPRDTKILSQLQGMSEFNEPDEDFEFEDEIDEFS